MIYVDDNYYDVAAFEESYRLFDQHPVLSQCRGKRLTVCLSDAAQWLALCLYVKGKGGSVFPLPADTPLEAARRRARNSNSHFLLFGDAALNSDAAAEQISDHGLEQEAVLVQMSSGTTGEPKFIARSWQSIDREIASYVEHFPEANDMTPIVACPATHSYGLICGVFVALERGVTPIVIQNNNPKFILRKLKEAGKPLLYSSPTLITAITMFVKEDKAIHAIMTSGTLMQGAWFNKVKAKTRHLYQQYGCSEAGCIAVGKDISSFDEIGKPLPHLQLVAGNSADKPQEIIVKTESGTAIATRDLGYFDDEANLHYVSRIDDMINVSGLNVYPGEVEEVVLEMPKILDAVVYKRNHSFGNDQVCLNYISDQEVADNEIREWCKQFLATYQIPMRIERVQEIPRLPNGKVSRKKIALDCA